MRYLFAFLIIVSGVVFAGPQSPPLPVTDCAVHVPYGQPEVAPIDATLICRRGYFTLHDNHAKIPIWTAWIVSPEHVNGCVPRSNAFATDQSLQPGSRATPQDYVATGYDQGHIANASHQSWNRIVEVESFIMSNMVPQLPGLNRGIWKLLETVTGAWTYSSQHSIAIIAGPIYNSASDKTIGIDHIIVPYAFYKLAIDTHTGATLAFLFPHKENQGNDLTVVQVTVADVEKASGIKFGIPLGRSKTVKEMFWPVDFKSVAQAKKKLCGSTAE